PLARAAGEGRRPEPARRRLRAVVRPERVVLRVGGCRPARPRRPSLIESAWGGSSPLSVGVEEEIMILGGESFEPVGAIDLFLRESEGLDLPGRLKTELHASIVELNTRICADAAEAVAALAKLRAAAEGRAARLSLVRGLGAVGRAARAARRHGRLHAALVGRAAAPTLRHARGADAGPADRPRAYGRFRRAAPGARGCGVGRAAASV